ncbi:hypothetical protein J4Q44_G00318820 [Coregonus suidteri]|uniref:Uncharacterized protein n=1 Tax=Coregonus suidteri TaxID=861788 RepID=A0AAN8KXX0_9TELE
MQQCAKNGVEKKIPTRSQTPWWENAKMKQMKTESELSISIVTCEKGKKNTIPILSK